MKQPDVWFLPTKGPVPLPLPVVVVLLVSTSMIIFIVVGYTTSWMNSLMNPFKRSFHAGLWCLGHVALSAEVLRHPASQDSLLPHCFSANGHVLPPATFREHPATEWFIIGEEKRPLSVFPAAASVMKTDNPRRADPLTQPLEPPPHTHTQNDINLASFSRLCQFIWCASCFC